MPDPKTRTERDAESIFTQGREDVTAIRDVSEDEPPPIISERSSPQAAALLLSLVSRLQALEGSLFATRQQSQQESFTALAERDDALLRVEAFLANREKARAFAQFLVDTHPVGDRGSQRQNAMVEIVRLMEENI